MPNLIPVAPNASATKRGLVELATSAELQTGIDTQRAVTPESVKTALGTSKTFKQSGIPCTINTTNTYGHGLGAAPERITAWLRCTTAEFGYSIGDRIFIASNSTGSTCWASIGADATNLVVVTNAGSNALVGVHKSTRSQVTFTPANWVLDVRLDA